MESPASELSHPTMRRLLAYWRGKCSGDRLPGRRDIDPLDFPDLLPFVALYDVVRDGGDMRFRIRLLGTAIVQLMGADSTGKFLEEQLRPDDGPRVIATFRQVVEQASPQFARSHLAMFGREHRHYERLLLPLAADGRTVDMVFALYCLPETEAGRS